MAKIKVPFQPDNITIQQGDRSVRVIWQTPHQLLRQQRFVLFGLALVLGAIGVLLGVSADSGRDFFSTGLFILMSIGFALGAWQLPSLRREIILEDGTLYLQRDGNPAKTHPIADVQDIKHGKASIQRGVFLDVSHTGLVEFMHSLSEDEARFVAYALRQALFAPAMQGEASISEPLLLIDEEAQSTQVKRG